jgi:hypothetical protein
VWYWHLPKTATQTADLGSGGLGGLSENPHQNSVPEEAGSLRSPSETDDGLSGENGRPKLSEQEKAALRDQVAREQLRLKDEEQAAADQELDWR